MSIQSEVERISGNVAATYAAIEEKGGALPEEQTSANLASAVDGIPQMRVSDTNPIGTVISFMGTAAPKDYLVCDGAEYSVSEYPELAASFTEQFGAVNHFGGDGIATFAVPDMRNLFLRGYHGEAEEQLSGDIGAKQDGTLLQYMVSRTTSDGNNYFYGPKMNFASSIQNFISQQNVDSRIASGQTYIYAKMNVSTGGSPYPEFITSRPVNMAVLYCIKAVESVPAENVYSTEETRIGTWIDGKPLYRKTIPFTSQSTEGETHFPLGVEVGSLVKLYGELKQGDTVLVPIPSYYGANDFICAVLVGDMLSVKILGNAYLSKPCTVTIEYTKPAG